MVVDLQELAQRMLADYDARTPGQLVGGPIDLTTEQPYALQTEITRMREERGEKVIGYKVGCTSRTIQGQLGVKEPIFGRLFDTGCFRSGTRLSHARFANLAVEGELAVRLGKDLPGRSREPSGIGPARSREPSGIGPARLAGPTTELVSVEECREAIAELFPVIELHHYVIPAAWPPGQWLIASNGIHAGFVSPELARRASKGPPSTDPCWRGGLTVRINEVVVGAVEDAASLNLPVESLRWLAGRLAQFGAQLCKGQVVLAGSPLPLFPVAPGSRIVVEAVPLGASRVEIDP